MGVIIIVCLITLALILWAVADNTQINELIKQGYLPVDYTTEDIFKLCNPQNDSEREALEGAPNHFQACITRGGYNYKPNYETIINKITSIFR